MQMLEKVQKALAEFPINALVGIVMKNSGGSANPETVRKVISALRGESVSFVELPGIKDEND